MARNYRAKLVGVFGDTVDDNPTGVMEEAGFRAKGLNYRYITAKVQPEALGAAIAGARAIHMKGFNLTMPHKVRVIPFLDGMSEAARIIGAVNTVYEENGLYIGENTDGKGFVEAMQMQGAPIEGKRIVLLGAGGAGKAIGVECALAGAKHITVINRNRERGEDLARVIAENTACGAAYLPWEGTVKIPECDILINATCVGLAPNASEKPDIDYDGIAPGHGGFGRGVQPRMAAVFARGPRPRRQGHHGAGHAGSPGRAQFYPLDRRRSAVRGHV